MMARLKLHVYHRTMVLRGFRGPVIVPPLCRGTPVSRTTNDCFHSFSALIVVREGRSSLSSHYLIASLRTVERIGATQATRTSILGSPDFESNFRLLCPIISIRTDEFNGVDRLDCPCP